MESENLSADRLAAAYLVAAGGDPKRALDALAHRALSLARTASSGLIRCRQKSIFARDCAELERETTRLSEPFAPLEEAAP